MDAPLNKDRKGITAKIFRGKKLCIGQQIRIKKSRNVI